MYAHTYMYMHIITYNAHTYMYMYIITYNATAYKCHAWATPCAAYDMKFTCRRRQHRRSSVIS